MNNINSNPILARVNARLEAYAKKNSFYWETMTEGSRVALMNEILMEEIEREKYANMNIKDWLIEAVDAGGFLIENVSKTVWNLMFCDGSLSHIRYKDEVIEIDWKNSLPNYKNSSILLFGWDEERNYVLYRFQVVVPFVK